MKRALTLLAGASLAGCASNIASMPPAAYRGDGMVMVIYVDTRVVHERCAAMFGPMPAGRTYMACGGRVNGVAMAIRPNPCEAAYRKDDTAVLSCHEDIAHGVNGWRHEFGAAATTKRD